VQSEKSNIIHQLKKDILALQGLKSVCKNTTNIYLGPIANAFPNAFSTLIRSALTGEWAQARNLHYKLLELHQWLYIEGNPVGIKEALCHLGLADAEVRLPLAPMSDANKKKLHEAMGALAGMG